MLRFWGFWASLVIGLVVACGSSSNATVLPVTGIIIRAETLTTGRGCGVGATQLYKYLATVYVDEGFTQEIVTNVFDCFSDGAFVSVPGGDRTFHLKVFGFNKPTFDASGATAANANWSTTCTATQQQDVLALADCLPLGTGNLGEGAVTLPLGSFALSDGGVATCGTVSDAGTSDADAGDAEAGAPSATATTYRKAILRVVRRGSAEIVAQATVTCPDPYTVTLPSNDYRVEVGLLDANEAPVAQLSCSVSARPGTTSTATCP